LGKRRKAREIVLQALYEAEFSDSSWEEILAYQTDRRASTEETIAYARDLFSKTLDHVSELDEIIRGALQNWAIERVSLVDKNILRYALAEILYFPQVPSKVIINEAIEISSKYSSKDAGKFINGILDRFVHDYRKDLV
jgi:N utilization substance protein B